MSEQRCGDRLPIAHATLVCGRPRGHDDDHRCTRADGTMTGWNVVPAPAAHPVTADVQRELARRRIWQALEWVGVLDGSNDPGRDEAYLNAEIDSTLTALIADAEKRAAARALREAASAIWVVDGNSMRVQNDLRDRAAALDPAGAAEGAGR